MNKEKVVKFSLDPSNQEHQKVIDFLDTLGRGMRVKWLLAWKAFPKLTIKKKNDKLSNVL
jgi:hypothetical protein